VAELTARGLVKHIARTHLPLAIAWLVVFVYGYPGQMVPDTFEHLIEARTGVYTDGHPPVINLLYWLSDHTFGGQLLVFLVQTTAFVLGAYALMRRLVGPRAAGWLGAALVLFPPVFAPLAIVWKDVLMPALLMLGIAGILDARRWVRLLGLAALFAAIALRYNAFAAAFPPIVLLFVWRPGMWWLKRYALATAAWLAITLAAFGVNAALTDQQMHYWHSSLALHDIAGTLHHVDGTLPDAELAPVFAGTGLRVERDIHATLRARYRVGNFFDLVGPKDPLWVVPLRGTEPAPQAQRDAIGRAWWTIVSTHPGAYATHRLAVWRECLSFKKGRTLWAVPGREFAYPETARREGISIEATPLQHAMTAALDRLWKKSALFEPSLYFIVTLLLLPLAWRHRDVLALLASGLAMELTLLLLAASPDYRYSHWMVLCTTVAIVTLIARRAHSAWLRPAATIQQSAASQARIQ